MKSSVFTLRLIAVILIGCVLLSSCKSGEKANTADANAEASETDASKQFCAQFQVDDLLALLEGSKEDIAKTGMELIYEEELQDKEEPGLSYYECVFGKYVKKADKKDFMGYDIKSTADHSIYFIHNLDTSDYSFLCFSDEGDANSFIDKLMKYGVVESGKELFIVREKLAESVKAESTMDYYVRYCLSSSPVFEDGFYKIRVYPYV